VRVSVKLTDASDQAQVWAERFDGAADDAFDLQDQVALATAAQVAPAIDAVETHRALDRPIEELSPHELFLRATHLRRWTCSTSPWRAIPTSARRWPSPACCTR
jgi:hypothetical protein